MRQHLDLDGQPPRAIHHARRIERGVSEMLGICKGVLLDGFVSTTEAEGLAAWIDANPDALDDFAVAAVARRLTSVFADGVVTAEERADLAELLRQVVGGTGFATCGLNAATSLPLDSPAPRVVFPGQTFVLTGKFAFGPRKVCEAAIANLGGECNSSVTKRTNFLVIGSFGSQDWVQTSYGTKILKAAEYRDSGSPLMIVAEDHWADHL